MQPAGVAILCGPRGDFVLAREVILCGPRGDFVLTRATVGAAREPSMHRKYFLNKIASQLPFSCS